MKEIKVELDKEGFAINNCPHFKWIKLGGLFCCNFCKYFIRKDVKNKLLVCNSPFSDEINEFNKD